MSRIMNRLCPQGEDEDREGAEAVGVENGLTADQLAALTAGDTVAIESGAEFSRRRYRTGRVVRIDASNIVISSEGPRGGTFIECYSRRDGVRIGGLGRAELINPDPTSTGARRQTLRVDALYREWTRNRADVDRLRQLHAAISECLEAAQAETGRG
jgi:ribosome maturation factor RimP